MLKLLRTLHTRPDLAHRIVTFDGSLYPIAPVVSTPSIQRQQRPMNRSERALSSTIVILIHNMMNVKSLTLHDFSWVGTPCQAIVCNAISSTLSFTSLTALAVEGRDFGERREYSSQLSLILRSQPLLECLELRSGAWDLGRWIFRSGVPRLTRLVARLDEAKVLVPGRPITSLSIKHMSGPPSLDVWEALAASTAKVTALALDAGYGPLEPSLRSIALHLQSIQELVITGVSIREIEWVC
ncbi:hypothetical protein FRB94_005109 [Tulasnella sp. JGI-2019a]|nr:hypothetical protein FRB94_005109 [Tulasnella sp. JGI-2019a]